MARNTKKNRYIPVPLALTGKTLERLQADAGNFEMEDALGKLLALRVGEYYEAVYEGRILPKGLAYNGVSIMQVNPMVGNGAMGSGPRSAPALPFTPPMMPTVSTPTSSATFVQEPVPEQGGGSKVIEFTTSLDDDMDYFAEEDDEE